MVCPLCGGSVKHVPGESIHVTFDRHARQSCDPTRHPARVPRCPVPGCKEKLSSVNAYRCKTCRVEVCLKHRFAAKHFCGDRTKLRGGGIGATGEAAPAAGGHRRSRGVSRTGVRAFASPPETSRAIRIVAGRPRCPSRVKCAISVALPFRTSRRSSRTRKRRIRREGAVARRRRREDERGAGGVPEVRFVFRGRRGAGGARGARARGRREALAKVLVAV